MTDIAYGCIGRQLTHSYSVAVHHLLGDYSYSLLPLEPDELAAFMQKKAFRGINVTIPYKKAVMPYLDVIENSALQIGAVNTVVNKNGTLYGYNTDAYGLTALLTDNGMELNNKKVLVLGSGGTSKTAVYVAKQLGAKSVYTVSRNQKDGVISYEEAVSLHGDTEIIINTTPVGMFPDSVGQTPINLNAFQHLSGVADAVYNPLRSELVLAAQKRGIPSAGGLYMLVMQAVKAAEYFTGKAAEAQKAQKAYQSILQQKQNIVLIGMPTCGKSTVGKILSRFTGKKLADTDAMIINREQKPISELFSQKGEAYFREAEADVIKGLRDNTGLIIATGGGSILREENVNALKANGILCFLDAPLQSLFASKSRPLSTSQSALEQLYHQRYPIYKSSADVTVPTMDTPEQTALTLLKEVSI